MQKKALIIALACLGLSAPAWSKTVASAPLSLDAASERILGHQLLTDLTGAQAKRSIRGATAVWTQVLVQAPASSPMPSLEADLRTTDVEGLLRDAKFRLMDPARKSLAIGLRPTVVLSVIFVPKEESKTSDYYLVTVRALQDAKPLGGDTITLCTWINVHDPVPASGNVAKDTEAIRAAARESLKTFIQVTQDKE